jgi:hypothetical protein
MRPGTTISRLLFVRLGWAIEQVGAKRVVLDTVEAPFGVLSNELVLRSEIGRLFRWLKDRGMTAQQRLAPARRPRSTRLPSCRLDASQPLRRAPVARGEAARPPRRERMRRILSRRESARHRQFAALSASRARRRSRLRGRAGRGRRARPILAAARVPDSRARRGARRAS